MQRIVSRERENWKELAESLGFPFHTIDGNRYWDESAYYQFSLQQVEQDLEAPTDEIHAMCLDLVADIVGDEQSLSQLDIPVQHWDFVRNSWLDRQPHLYGRMDFSYNGKGPAKLLELNYDTPTSLYESAFFQWVWLEQAMEQGIVPRVSDQFNSIQEGLIQVFTQLQPNITNALHFSCVKQSNEDRGTIDYLRDCATQAGIPTKFIAIEDIGASTDGRFTDLEDNVIAALFKLYPWEHMFREAYGALLSNCGTQFLEPAWKSLLSNKGILPLLWKKHAGHPNLLPSYIDNTSDVLQSGWVRKPFFSREGANITMQPLEGGTIVEDGPYTEAPFIRQAYCPLPCFNGYYTLVGSWVMGNKACGIGIREDSTLITKDSSRFVPHIIR